MSRRARACSGWPAVVNSRASTLLEEGEVRVQAGLAQDVDEHGHGRDVIRQRCRVEVLGGQCRQGAHGGLLGGKVPPITRLTNLPGQYS